MVKHGSCAGSTLRVGFGNKRLMRTRRSTQNALTPALQGVSLLSAGFNTRTGRIIPQHVDSKIRTGAGQNCFNTPWRTQVTYPCSEHCIMCLRPNASVCPRCRRSSPCRLLILPHYMASRTARPEMLCCTNDETRWHPTAAIPLELKNCSPQTCPILCIACLQHRNTKS